MTVMDQTPAISPLPTRRDHATNLLTLWRGRQNLRRSRKTLSELPDRLLRDVGPVHLIDHTPHRSFHHRLRQTLAPAKLNA